MRVVAKLNLFGGNLLQGIGFADLITRELELVHGLTADVNFNYFFQVVRGGVLVSKLW